MALYSLPGKVRTSLRLYLKGAPAQPITSLLPGIFNTCLERLADPSPSHHKLRAPFIRPLINTKASFQPIYNLLSPAHVAGEEELAPDSPLQAQLIEFFEEQKQTLLLHTHLEEDLPKFVYCLHRKVLLGPPQLVINETYNANINNAAKPAAVFHAVSVLCHQMSLLLQARADPKFSIITSRRPSDLDSRDINHFKRAAFADFQLEKRGSDYQIAGVLQPSIPEASSPDVPFYQPRAVSQSALLRWYSLWTQSQWDPRATLDVFTVENTVPWGSIEDVYTKTVMKGDSEVEVKVPVRSKRTIEFATPPTSQELQHPGKQGQTSTGETLEEESTGEWERGNTAQRQQERRRSWIDQLSANDLGKHQHNVPATRAIRVKRTGPNSAPLVPTRTWGGQSSPSPAPAPQARDRSKDGWKEDSESGSDIRKWRSRESPQTNKSASTSSRPRRFGERR